ncbi:MULTISPECIES: hypothetical protein [unclassified Streptomyces]|uniref:hypothetical protein n=1 Tax=unclassified Streptomyces TaxID=2593676 RepID=UPI003D8CA3F2
MRRTVLPIVAILLTAACGASANHTGPAPSHSSSGPAAKKKHSAAAPAKHKPSSAKPKPSQSSKTCSPTRDIIVWTKTPGLPDSAQELGNYNLETCESTFQWLKHASPTGPGYCTEAAWASDNPNYNVDAEPAKRLKKVQVTIGPAC